MGNYDLEEEIGRGGMGVVFRARQRGLNRIVAVKMVRGGALADPAALARFRVEAELVARLRHPQIIQIHEIGEFEGQPYYSMDYVEGRSLDTLVRDQPLPARRAAGYLAAIAEAVEHAHRQGVLHRDLKPSNILIDGTDTPRVLDFGLARPLTEASELTVGTQPLGSPSYAAPEQAEGRQARVGPPADVYSLGAILYHLLAGRPPLVADSLAATLRLVQETEPVALRLLNPTVPVDLATICHACLEKEPSRRYPTAAALAADLRRFLGDEPIRARPVGRWGRLRRWCRRRRVVAGLGGALGLLSLALLIGSPLVALRIDRLRRATEREAYASNIGLIKSHLDQGSTDVALALLAQCPVAHRHWEWGYLIGRCHSELASFRTAASSNAVVLEFGGDGRRLLTVVRSGLLQVWDPFTEREVFRFADTNDPVRSATLDAAGLRVAGGCVSGRVRFWALPAWGGGTDPGRVPATIQAHAGPVNCVRWIDGGDRVLTAGDDGRVRIWSVADGTEEQELACPWRRVRSVGLSPEGDRIRAQNDIGTTVWERASGRPVSEGVARGNEGEVAWLDPTGRYAVSVDDEDRLNWRSAGGRSRELIRIRGLPSGPLAPRVFFSADGRWFANLGDDRTARVWRGEDGGEQIALPGRVHDGVFSPDGRLLATSGSYNYAVLWDLETGRERLRLTGHQGLLMALAFSADSRLVAGLDRRGEVRVWATQGEPDRWDEANSVWGAGYSPDGRRVVLAPRYEGWTLCDARTGRVEVRVRTPLEWVAGAAFSPDGTRLVTVGSHRRVRVWDVGSWRLRASLAGHDRCVLGAGFSRDGRVLFSYSLDGVVRLWDGESLAARRTVETGLSGPVTAALSADGRWVAAGDESGTVGWWRTETGERAMRVKGHAGAVYGVAFSPDGARLVTSSVDGSVTVWDRATGRAVGGWAARGCDWPLVFSEDGRRLFAGTTRFDFATRDDPRLVVRDALDGRELLAIEGCGMVASLGYSATERRVVTGAFEGFGRQLTAFPWREDEYDSGAGGTAADRFDRFDRFGKAAWSNRLAALGSPPGSGESGPRLVDAGWEPDRFATRDPRAGREQVDLGGFYTAPLEVVAFPTFGPFNTDCDLRDLPSGLSTWGGVTMDVRGVVQLGRTDGRGPLFRRGWERCPRTVTGIPVGCRGSRLHVLHGTVGVEDERRVIGRYTCTFADGSRHAFEIVYGEDVRAHGPPGAVDPAETTRGRLVWQGMSPVGRRSGAATRVYLASYAIPHPDREMVRIDFESMMTGTAPFLLAVTVE